MKVLFINSVIDYGSTGKIVRELANELESKGHEVLIAYGRNKAKFEYSTFDLSSLPQFGWHFLMTRLFGRHGLHSSKATQNLINKIEEFDPDIIHLHNLHGYYLNVPKLMKYFKSRFDIQVVWTMHDLWAISGSSAHYSYAGCAKWDEGCVICNDPKEYPYSWFFDRQKKNFKWKREVFNKFPNLIVVTVSKWLKEELEKSFFIQYDIVPIYNGLDFNDFDFNFNKVDPYPNDDKINLLGVSSEWKERKGFDDFIKLSKTLEDKYQLTLVGLTKNQLSNLPDNINGIEKTDNFEELVKYYQGANLYLNLSVEETMGMTTVESLASGTPVVVYDQTAVPEIIDNTVGKVTPANNIPKLVKAIEEMLNRNIGADVCIEFAKKNYSQEEMMKKYFNVYKINDTNN